MNEYEEGTLLLDFLHPESHQLFWRGSASALISENVTPEERQAKVRAAVEKILERFPPDSHPE